MIELRKMLDEVYKKSIFDTKSKKKIFSLVDEFMDSLSSELKVHKIDAEVFLGGSSAKGTFLKGNFDCDIFIRFDYAKYKDFNPELSDIAESVIEKVTNKKAIRVHGSRDYFQFTPRGTGFDMTYEMIPVLHVSDPEKSLNVTDMSPLHVLWMRKKIRYHPDFAREAVLTKLFLKATELYGAESYIRGFSGHDVDILISYYGTFIRLIEAAFSWKKGLVIDVENHFKDEISAVESLNEDKLGPLILIDPVLPDRNAAASLTLEKFDLFKEHAVKFLSDPNKSYFKKKKFSLTNLKKQKVEGAKLFVFYLESKSGKNDVVGSKLLKVHKYIAKRIKLAGFELKNKGWHWNKKDACHMWYYVDKSSMKDVKDNPFIMHRGPPLKNHNDVLRFKKKNKDTFLEGQHICAKVKREFLTMKELFDSLPNRDYVHERGKNPKIIHY